MRELATYGGPGDPKALLADPRTLLLAAVDGERPVGFVLAHELLRKHGDKEATLIEVVTRGTVEEFASNRRRQHQAYQ